MKAVHFPHRSLEVSCALEGRAVADRLGGWAALCEEAEIEEIDGGVRLWLRPALGRAAIELATRESDCCPFLDFELTREEGRLRFDVTSPVREAGSVIAAITGTRGLADPP